MWRCTLVQEPDIDKYAQAKGVQAIHLQETDTLATLLQIQELGLEVASFTAVHSSATLADARAAMANIPHCKDIFVTQDGQKTGTVLGWLTNSELARAM